MIEASKNLQFDSKFRWKPWEIGLAAFMLLAGLAMAIFTMSFEPLIACVAYPMTRGLAVGAELGDVSKRQRRSDAAKEAQF